jgi:xanthine dehydrogenase YagS FAD-binding subunit
MRPFSYVREEQESKAEQSGRIEGASFIAGGTGLVDLMRLGVEAPATVVDITGLSWTKVEQSDGGGLRIGAMVRNSDLAYHERVQKDYAVLSEALLSGASAQVRNMATVGGNLLQRTRCSYFRDPAVTACNKREPGSGCAALKGYTRMHAILGGSNHCIAVHPSDMCVALLALDAEIETTTRKLPISELHLEPGKRPDRENVLESGELIRSVLLPRSSAGRKGAYVKARDRASFAFALASAAVVLDLDGARIRDVRIAFGGIATRPWRSREAEHVLRGEKLSDARFGEAAENALKGARPRAGNEFKVELAKRVLVRALQRAGGMA